MATIKDTTEKGYLKEVYSELEGIKTKLLMLRDDLAKSFGRDSRVFREHDRHLLEMGEYIEWKLQVLEKGTAFDWKAAGENVESTVSVRNPDTPAGPDFSGGYLGG